jgi:N-acetylmuramoyl-L-alanine amidase
MHVDRHLLRGPGTAFRPSPNQGGPYAAPNPDTIIVHYTAGADAESAIQILSDPERQVSAHLVIGRDGSITQLVPFDTVAWHAGVSRWGQRQAFNQHSLGIEIDNAGQLQEEDGRLVSWFGRQYPAEEVVWGVHRNQTEPTPWHRYPVAQVGAVFEVCRLLVGAYRIRHILGHEEIAPDRKVDPGPAFPLDALRARLLTGELPQTAGGSARVSAARLNVRAEPDGRAARVAGHLLRGTRLEVIDRRGAWCRIRASIEGWVAARHVEPGTPRGPG